ncbi:YbaK/EbsC family protein [Faecalicatena contorta]|uniref:YbaK/EbsC family protein n=1 Tax=Clostridia TaxID=186801 RepID=UPI00051C27D2|nr:MULTISPECIES: YbaK/EbsC family protein [Clostridia]MBM6684432.1 YbaK/EbsC family protein [Faecalicatena contorta]MBM6709255.1 YbaK/EbsC family protein [Faecalicatena contorta]
MSIEKVRSYFRQWPGMEERILEFPVSSATVAEAAKAVGTEERRIAKTLSFMLDEGPILVVAAGDAKIDNKKFKGTFHKKASMLKVDELPELVGHPVGGVCPFGIREGVKVYLDQSLRRFPTVFPACGSANSAIELTIPELETYSRFAEWVDVCRIPE